jgi:hypothetical protein
MMNTFWRIAIPCCAFAFFGACNGSSSQFEEATGEGSIRGLHAIADLGSVRFLIEETTLATIDFKDVSAINDYDNLTYEFNFDILLPNDSDYTRMATYEQKIDADNEYTFVLTGTLAEPEVVVWQQFGRDGDAALADAEEMMRRSPYSTCPSGMRRSMSARSTSFSVPRALRRSTAGRRQHSRRRSCRRPRNTRKASTSS